jgi:hypothetical protein
MLCTVSVKPKCLVTANVFSKSTAYWIVVTDRLAKCVDAAIFEISLEHKVTHSLKDRELNQLFVHDIYAFLLILSSFLFAVYTRCSCFFVILFFYIYIFYFLCSIPSSSSSSFSLSLCLSVCLSVCILCYHRVHRIESGWS